MNREGEHRLGIESHMIDDAKTRISPFLIDRQMLEIISKGVRIIRFE